MIAHVGHWAADLLYVLPVLVVVAWISVRALLDRRAAAAASDAETPAPAPPPAGDPPG
jgi:hypothetical protein